MLNSSLMLKQVMARLLFTLSKDTRPRIILIEIWLALAPSVVKLDKQFRESSLKKGQDPEVWTTELEDLRVRLDDMGSSNSENQLMIHVLNNLTLEYNLQLASIEKRI
jgi:hypothetical protein